jgi:hypothetical protein
MRVTPKYHYNLREKITPPVDIYQAEIDVQPTDKLRMERFFREETNYYNRLVEGFSSIVRTFPDLLAGLSNHWLKVFAFVAETQTSLRPYLRVDLTKEKRLPRLLESYAPYLGEITERHVILSELATGSAVLLPIVRRHMATAIFEYYQEQARRILTPAANSDSKDGDAYKIPPEMLEQVDYDHKRHLQIPKGGLQVSWNALTESSELSCGYVGRPIVLPKINLLLQSNWNYAVIRQAYHQSTYPWTPWVIDIRKISTPYLLKQFDSKIRKPRDSHSDAAKGR